LPDVPQLFVNNIFLGWAVAEYRSTVAALAPSTHTRHARMWVAGIVGVFSFFRY
jgi:hypothetical protein